MATKYTLTDDFDEDSGFGLEPESSRKVKKGLDDPRLSSSPTPFMALDKLTKPDLNKVATDLGIKRASRTKKSDLLFLIRKHPSFLSTVKDKAEKTPKPDPSEKSKHAVAFGPGETGSWKKDLITVRWNETYKAEMGNSRSSRKASRTFYRKADADQFLVDLKSPEMIEFSMFAGRDPRIENIQVTTGEDYVHDPPPASIESNEDAAAEAYRKAYAARASHEVPNFDTESFGDEPESASAMSDEEIEKRARDLFIEDVDERSPEDLLEEIQRIEAGGGDDKPPDPPGSVTDSFDEDDEDDEDPSFPGTRLPDSADISSRTSPSDAARIEREIVQRRKREERLAILQQQRKAQLQMRIEQRERSLQNKLRRKQIQTESREIETPETESTASDRIIRRLSAFSIGRSMGASGQLFAALSELMVFQPEEQAADALTKQSKEEAQQQKATQLEQLEKEILQQSVSDMEQSAKLQDIVDTARTQLADPSPEISGDALSAFEQSLNDLVSKTVDPDSESPAPPQSTPESLSSRDSGGTTQPPTGPPSPPGPPGPPGPPTDPSQPESQGLIGTLQKQLGGLGQGLNTTTKVFLATAATVETLNIASKATTQTIKALGSVMQDPDNVGSAIKGAGSAASSTAQLGGGLAGGVIGRLAGPAIGTAIGTAVGPAVGTAVGPAIAASATAIGTAMAPGVGTLIGFALGSTLGRTIAEPIVEGISTVFGAMDSFANDSIGFETLQTSALGEIRILLEKMERQQKLDPLTAQFIEVRTELRSALGDLQGSLLELFGPSITKSLEFLEDITIILTAISDAAKVIKDAMPGSLTTGIKLTTGVGLMLVLLERLVKAADAAADILDKDNAPGFAEAQKVIDEFFNTQKQFDGLIPKFTFGP